MANIREAFDYAAKNPTSDFAKNLEQQASSGALDIEAQKYGLDLSPFKPKPVEPKKEGIIKRTINNVKEAVTDPLNVIPQRLADTVRTDKPLTSIDKETGRVTLNKEAAQKIVDATSNFTGGGTVTKEAKNAIKAIPGKLRNRAIDKVTNLVASNENTLTKGERQAAIDEGRVIVDKLGKTKYLPTDTEKRAGQLLADKLKSNPVKNVPVVKKEISKLGQEAETYLDANKKPISAEKQADMFNITREKMARYSTETEMKAYDEQVNMFTKLIPGRGGFNTSNFYKALKEYEDNVASKLARGKEALLDPTGAASAKLQAAKDIRKTVRDTIGELHDEFKPKMFDIASLYDALDNLIVKAEKTGGNLISRTAKKYPAATNFIKGGIITGAGIKLLDGN